MANRVGVSKKTKGRTMLGNKPRIRPKRKEELKGFLESLASGYIEFKTLPVSEQDEVLRTIQDAQSLLGKEKTDQILSSGIERQDLLDLNRRVLSHSDRTAQAER